MPASAKKVVNVRYRASSGTVTLKNAFYNGIRIRESDSATIISLTQPDDHKSITIDIGKIDTVWVDGKTRKLRSPGSQHKFREAELKHLLEGKKLEEWTSPYLRSYSYEGIKAKKSPFSFLGAIVSASGMALLSLPALGGLGILGLIGFMVWKMFVGAH